MTHLDIQICCLDYKKLGNQLWCTFNPFFQYSRSTQTPLGTFSLLPANPEAKGSPRSLLLEDILFYSLLTTGSKRLIQIKYQKKKIVSVKRSTWTSLDFSSFFFFSLEMHSQFFVKYCTKLATGCRPEMRGWGWLCLILPQSWVVFLQPSSHQERQWRTARREFTTVIWKANTCSMRVLFHFITPMQCYQMQNRSLKCGGRPCQ